MSRRTGGRGFFPETREEITVRSTIGGPAIFATAVILTQAIIAVFAIISIFLIGDQSGAVIMGACLVYVLSTNDWKHDKKKTRFFAGGVILATTLTVLTTIGYGPSRLVNWGYSPSGMLVGFAGRALVLAPYWLVWVRIGFIPITPLISWRPIRAFIEAMVMEIIWPKMREAPASQIDVSTAPYPDDYKVGTMRGRTPMSSNQPIEEDWSEHVGIMEATEV